MVKYSLSLHDTVPIFEVIGAPDLDADGFFRKDIVDPERKGLITEILARENDKMKYAMDRAVGIYTEGTVYSARAFGDIRSLEETDGRSLLKAYDKMIRKGAVVAAIAGRYDRDLTDRVTEMLSGIFEGNAPEKEIIPGRFPHNYRRRKDLVVMKEIKDVEQAKICLICEDVRSSYSAQDSCNVLLNEILGGDVDSLLFKVVREELALAYSVFSFNIASMNALVMMAGIDGKNLAKAAGAMTGQLERIKEGNYPDRIIESAKTSLRSTLLQSSDTLKEMLSDGMSSLHKSRYVNNLDLIDEIERITKADICTRAAKFETAVDFSIVSKKRKKQTSRPD